MNRHTKKVARAILGRLRPMSARQRERSLYKQAERIHQRSQAAIRAQLDAEEAAADSAAAERDADAP